MKHSQIFFLEKTSHDGTASSVSETFKPSEKKNQNCKIFLRGKSEGDHREGLSDNVKN